MPQLIASVKGVEVKHMYLHKDRTTLGRKPGNDIVLDTMVVSGQHCVFDLVGVADVFLTDLGSTNGTCVNDHMVKERTRLHDGDVIAIGPYRIRYLQASEAPSTFGGTLSFTPDALHLQGVFTIETGTSGRAGSAGGQGGSPPSASRGGVGGLRRAAPRRLLRTPPGRRHAPVLNGATVGSDPIMLVRTRTC
jgi:hypothetical protein